jgi:uncharacterized protein (DUF433 family)
VQLEDYFDFHTEPVEYIRFRGHRIDLDFVLEMFLGGKSPDEIAKQYPTLSLVQVYVAITYYLQNKEAMDGYLARREKLAEANEREVRAQPPTEAEKRIWAIKAAHRLAGAS